MAGWVWGRWGAVAEMGVGWGLWWLGVVWGAWGLGGWGGWLGGGGGGVWLGRGGLVLVFQDGALSLAALGTWAQEQLQRDAGGFFPELCESKASNAGPVISFAGFQRVTGKSKGYAGLRNRVSQPVRQVPKQVGSIGA